MGLTIALTRATRTVLAADLIGTGAVSSGWTSAANWSLPQMPTVRDHGILTVGYVSVPANATLAVMDWAVGTVSALATVGARGNDLALGRSADRGQAVPRQRPARVSAPFQKIRRSAVIARRLFHFLQ